MAFQLLTWNEDRLESIATVIGPSITTAFCRSVSLPFLMKFTPVHEASTASPLDMQSDCYRQTEREKEHWVISFLLQSGISLLMISDLSAFHTG